MFIARPASHHPTTASSFTCNFFPFAHFFSVHTVTVETGISPRARRNFTIPWDSLTVGCSFTVPKDKRSGVMAQAAKKGFRVSSESVGKESTLARVFVHRLPKTTK
jgi:hypothetical protein